MHQLADGSFESVGMTSGIKVNHNGIGTRVEPVYGDKTLTGEVKMSRGMHNSMDTRTLHFGLGDFGCEFSMRVTWPDGKVQEFDAGDIERSRFLTPSYAGGLSQQ